MSRRGSGRWAQQAWGPSCEKAAKTRVTLAPGVDRDVHADAAEAFEALAVVLAANRYAVRPADTGAYNCRAVTGGTSPSLHSWPIAVDVNWNTNPYRKNGPLITDMPRAMVDNVKLVRTTKGVTVWEWGGDWKSPIDAMHFGIVATKAELAAGIDWTTVQQAKTDAKDARTWPTLREKSRGPTVAELQRRLSKAGHDVRDDGSFGPKTKAAVVAYQRARGLTPDGIVGLQTWTALLAGMEPLTKGEPSPVKRDAPKAKPRPSVPLVRRADGAVFIVADGVLIHVPDPNAFAAMRFQTAHVRDVPGDDPIWQLPRV